MNKVLSQAIKKAVSEYTSNNVVNIEDNIKKDQTYFHFQTIQSYFKIQKASQLKSTDLKMKI